MQLIVLGMHRSGTSILARTLNLMGAYFGAEGSGTGANDENPKGFWERRDVRMLNDSVLHAVGADWDRVAGFEAGALPAEVVDDFLQRASRLVLELDAHRPWFIKEPRLCLLLPLWRRVLELPVVVQVHRHPVEVAASLQTRNAIPIPAGLALWEKYVRAAATASDGLPVARVSHRGLVTRPVQEVERLHEQLVALGVQGLRMPSGSEIAAFVDEGLYRERESREDLREHWSAPQVALFEELEAGAQPAEPMSDAALRPLRDYEATLPPLQPRADAGKSARAIEAALHERVGAREQEAKLLREVVAKLEATVRQREENLAGDRIAIGRLEAEAGASERRIAALEAEAGARESRIATLEAVTTERQREIDTLEAAVASRERDLVALRVELEGCNARLATLAGELDASRKQRAQGEVALARRAAEIESLRQQLAEGGRRSQDAERRLERTERSLADRFDELAALTRLLLARDAAIEQARKELAASADKLRNSATELESARAELARIHASRSWRLAAPLRALARLAGRGKPSPQDGGELALVEQSGLFDRAWYLDAYPDVARSGLDPLEHYLTFGAFEQRNPGPGFNAVDYLRLNPDVAEAGINPLVHYIRHGRGEGRRLA